MRFSTILVVALFTVACADEATDDKKKHHHHHHHKHHKAASVTATTPVAQKANVAIKAAPVQATAAVATSSSKLVKTQTHTMNEADLVGKMKKLEEMLAAKESAAKAKAKVVAVTGELEVNGPLPFDFSSRFSKAVAAATGCNAADVKVTNTKPVPDEEGVMAVTFEAPSPVVQKVQAQAADPSSKLAGGDLRPLLVARDSPPSLPGPVSMAHTGSAYSNDDGAAPAAASSSAVDIDVEMPYGDLEPFGREDTAQELTEQSIGESDQMVDQIEKAEVAEEKRAVFRALTRLRGAAITSFDGIARSQTGNIDEYNKVNSWRKDHPLHHLADEESDVSKWAFPDNAD